MLVLMMLSMSGPSLIRKCNDAPIFLPEEETHMLDSLYGLLSGMYEQEAPMFFFDPNLLSEDSLELLGVPPQLAGRIGRYRNSGGRFREPHDLLKIYGMDSNLYLKLEPWVIRATPHRVASGEDSGTFPMDINTLQYRHLVERLKLSPELSARVLRYRDALGGFVDTSQLNEVYGMDSVALAMLMPRLRVSASFEPNKIHLNSDAAEEMQRHPYISRELAGSIVIFREINGRIRDEKELSGFVGLSSGDLEKLLPYIRF